MKHQEQQLNKEWNYGKIGIWGTWRNALRSKGNLNVAKKGETFSLYWWVCVTHPCFNSTTCLWFPGRYFLMLYLKKKIKKKKIVNPKAAKPTGALSLCPEPRPVLPQSQQSSACQPSHQPTVTAQTSFKPWFLVDVYSHLQTTEGNKNVSPSAVQVLLSMCFGWKPKCTRLFYQCLFLSFTAFISYPHQTCEHFEGWVTQIRLLSAVKSIIRQQNPLTSLLFRVPTQALTEKGT